MNQDEREAPAGRFRPRITLRTLGRGDGLLGMRPSAALGPRGGEVTIAWVTWTCADGQGGSWELPAPATIANRRPAAARFLLDDRGRRVLLRDVDAEADALDRIWDLGLLPLPADSLQWRDAAARDRLQGPLWTLAQETLFADFWADRLPELQSEGWSVVIGPGFAH
ncbi:MAG TPA: hypothetical protein VIM12_12315 [Noviherbaspirillum sp.]|uniref:hypothetical protein n=1 Tax=Noviherbaspirillum sp. TaxID=1926288 RepID=UPI002F953B27